MSVLFADKMGVHVSSNGVTLTFGSTQSPEVFQVAISPVMGRQLSLGLRKGLKELEAQQLMQPISMKEAAEIGVAPGDW